MDSGFGKRRKVLEVDGGDGCMEMWMYLTPLSCTLRNGYKGKFNVCIYFITIKRCPLKKKKEFQGTYRPGWFGEDQLRGVTASRQGSHGHNVMPSNVLSLPGSGSPSLSAGPYFQAREVIPSEVGANGVSRDTKQNTPQCAISFYKQFREKISQRGHLG